ncbi:MAG: Gfo/Idh/MocA family oxidoreductase [Candidatus Omnitrophica bacterium]|nr:Gfo/Idh/MocA family oxidoreductase [Candidatus Omnitrophota bacterium]
MKKSNMPRRDFNKLLAGASSILFLSPQVLGKEGAAPPSDRLSIAVIGCGGRGDHNLKKCENEAVIALADVDDERAAKAFNRYESIPKYKDFRIMLDKHSQVDAVLISTPDHTHTVAAMNAIQRGKHVYVEKPLAHTIYEVRQLMKAAEQNNVITQLGNQGHSHNDIRKICEWIWGDAIGPVKQVHAWYERPYGDGKPRPDDQPPVPETMEWDLWLGPAAHRPYHPVYAPGKWRSWADFGTGVLGDWVCHILDPAFWALKLHAPERIIAHNGDLDYSPERFPLQSDIDFYFPKRSDMPPVKVTWTYGKKIEIPQLQDVELNDWNRQAGAIFIGEKGCIVHGSHGGGGARLLPKSLAEEVGNLQEIIPRVEGSQEGHHQEWIRACKEGRPAVSDFSYGGPLSEIALLGVIATQHNEHELQWDAKAMQFKENASANEKLIPTYRKGWSLEG